MTETTGGPATTGRKSAARERLLTTASRLFYTEGIRAVGVDRVMAEADVARGTFYRHFEGKDDLVRGYLDATDHGIRARVAVAAERTGEARRCSMSSRTASARRSAVRGFGAAPSSTRPRSTRIENVRSTKWC